MKNNKQIYTMLISVALLFGLLIMASCVDVPTEAEDLPEFLANIRLMHVASEVGQASVSVDGDVKGTLTLGQASDYFTVDAGNRAFAVVGAEAETLFVATEFSGTVYVTTVNANDTLRFYAVRETWTYTPPLDNSIAAVKFVQFGLPDDTVEVNFSYTDPDDETASDATFNLAYSGVSNYRIDADGTANCSVVADADTVATFSQTFTGGTRSVVVIMRGEGGDLEAKIFDAE